MFKMIKLSTLVIAVLIVSGCVSRNPVYPVPPQTNQVNFKIAASKLDLTKSFPVLKQVGESNLYLAKFEEPSLGLVLIGSLTGGLGAAITSAVGESLAESKSQSYADSIGEVDLNNLNNSLGKLIQSEQLTAEDGAELDTVN